MIEVTSAAWADHITQRRFVVNEIDASRSGCWDADTGEVIGAIVYTDAGGVLYFINVGELHALHS